MNLLITIRCFPLAVLLATLSSSAAAQSQPAPSFAVASIKLSDPASPIKRALIDTSGHTFAARSATLADLIRVAYGVYSQQIIGGSSWLTQQKFDVTAVPDTDTHPTETQLPIMLQRLLSDRFQLTLHRDTRQLSVYALTVARGGPKLKPSPNPPPASSPANWSGIRQMGRGQLEGRRIDLDVFTETLGAEPELNDRPILNKTALTGIYDFTLNWTPLLRPRAAAPGQESAAPADSAGPSIFTALQEQLGLKLESTKAPTEVLLIDRAGKPTAN